MGIDLVHLCLPLAADDVDPDVPVWRHAHALQEEVEALRDQLVGHPRHPGRLVEHGLLHFREHFLSQEDGLVQGG